MKSIGGPWGGGYPNGGMFRGILGLGGVLPVGFLEFIKPSIVVIYMIQWTEIHLLNILPNCLKILLILNIF